MQAQPFLFNREDVLERRGERGRRRRQADDTTSGVYKGNDRFEGYIMALLDRIKTHVKGLDFDYEVELVPDGAYGIKKRYSDIWTGMIGEVVRKVRNCEQNPGGHSYASMCCYHQAGPRISHPKH